MPKSEFLWLDHGDHSLTHLCQFANNRGKECHIYGSYDPVNNLELSTIITFLFMDLGGPVMTTPHPTPTKPKFLHHHIMVP